MDKKEGNTGYTVLGVFFPLIGLILWAIWKQDRPEDARLAGKGAAIGALIYMIVILFSYLFTACAFYELDNLYY